MKYFNWIFFVLLALLILVSSLVMSGTAITCVAQGWNPETGEIVPGGCYSDWGIIIPFVIAFTLIYLALYSIVFFIIHF